MKYLIFLLTPIWLFSCQGPQKKLPRVIIATDINLKGGDPDDRQSWVHVLWYADELDIVGVIPDNWNALGYEAAIEGLDHYRTDYDDYGFEKKGYPSPEYVHDRIAKSPDEAIELIISESKKSTEPLYLLIWGQMSTLEKALLKDPEIASKVRVLSIGTGRKYGPKDEVKGEDCNVRNWNGRGRNEIYEDARFDKMWWLESNWTYNGMFMGDRPREMMETLTQFGSMGKHFKQVTNKHDWAQYFRCGDTPTVLYLIDPANNYDDPTHGSWAGKFAKPFPQKKPNYFTDDAGEVIWDYEDPCNTWDQVEAMYAHNKSTLLQRREDMYQSLLVKLRSLYGK